jgi:hypothetical protein
MGPDDHVNNPFPDQMPHSAAGTFSRQTSQCYVPKSATGSESYPVDLNSMPWAHTSYPPTEYIPAGTYGLSEPFIFEPIGVPDLTGYENVDPGDPEAFAAMWCIMEEETEGAGTGMPGDGLVPWNIDAAEAADGWAQLSMSTG